MEIVKFSKKTMKTEFFKVVELSYFGTRNGGFSYYFGVELQQKRAERWH